MHYFCGAAWPSPSQHVDTRCWMCGRNVPELQHEAEHQAGFVGSGPDSYSKEYIQEGGILRSLGIAVPGSILQWHPEGRWYSSFGKTGLPGRKQKDDAVCDSINTY